MNVIKYRYYMDFEELCIIMQKSGLIKSLEGLKKPNHLQERT